MSFPKGEISRERPGLTYEEILEGQPLVNSGLWVIPEWSDAYGLQIKIRRQGKAHLA